MKHNQFKPARDAWLRAMGMSILLGFSAPPAHAQCLQALLGDAMNHDASYRAAASQLDALRHRAGQAQATNLPQVSLSNTLFRSHLQSDVLNAGGGRANSQSTNNTLSVQLRQSLFDAHQWVGIDQSELAVQMGALDLERARSHLLIQLSDAYFNVLQADGVLEASKAHTQAIAAQLEDARKNFDAGNAAVTDALDAQARNDLAAADDESARRDLMDARAVLSKLVGHQDAVPQPVGTVVPALLMQPFEMALDEWTAQAVQSRDVRMADIARQMARLGTSKARAEHLPVASLFAESSKVKVNGSPEPTVQQFANAGWTASVGVRIDIPLFSGFATQRKIKESLSLEERAESNYDTSLRETQLQVNRSYLDIRSARSRLAAYDAAIRSANEFLNAAKVGYEAGERINRDVLDAQDRVARAQSNAQAARYHIYREAVKALETVGALKEEHLNVLCQ